MSNGVDLVRCLNSIGPAVPFILIAVGLKTSGVWGGDIKGTMGLAGGVGAAWLISSGLSGASLQGILGSSGPMGVVALLLLKYMTGELFSTPQRPPSNPPIVTPPPATMVEAVTESVTNVAATAVTQAVQQVTEGTVAAPIVQAMTASPTAQAVVRAGVNATQQRVLAGVQEIFNTQHSEEKKDEEVKGEKLGEKKKGVTEAVKYLKDAKELADTVCDHVPMSEGNKRLLYWSAAYAAFVAAIIGHSIWKKYKEPEEVEDALKELRKKCKKWNEFKEKMEEEIEEKIRGKEREIEVEEDDEEERKEVELGSTEEDEDLILNIDEAEIFQEFLSKLTEDDKLFLCAVYRIKEEELKVEHITKFAKQSDGALSRLIADVIGAKEKKLETIMDRNS